MTLKDSIASELTKNAGAYISGETLAVQNGVTRAAVNKAVKQLCADGYDIVSATKNGYKLSANCDVLTAETIEKYLVKYPDTFVLDTYSELSSTITKLKENVSDKPEGLAVIAASQSAGRGRLGRSFFSPKDSGVYLSLLLRPKLSLEDTTMLTSAAAVAMCGALRKQVFADAKIKWVNDVFIGAKKVCGILTEAVFNLETGTPDYIILSFGLNVYEPSGGFPKDLRQIAGSVLKARERDAKSRIVAQFLTDFWDLYTNFSPARIQSSYKENCFVLGKRIKVIRGDTIANALALDLDDRCHLLVRYEDGSTDCLSNGEISIRTVDEN